MQSKAVANSGAFKKRWEPAWWKKLLRPFEWLYEQCVWRVFKRTPHMWAYLKYASTDFDFDSVYLIRVNVFKLKRMLRAFTNNPHCIHEPKDLQALRLAIRLGERLSEVDYDYAARAHERKWGELNMDFEPLPEEEGGKHAGSVLKFWRKEVTPETEEQERQEFLAAVEADDKARERDARLFFGLLSKYYRNWWD